MSAPAQQRAEPISRETALILQSLHTLHTRLDRLDKFIAALCRIAPGRFGGALTRAWKDSQL